MLTHYTREKEKRNIKIRYVSPLLAVDTIYSKLHCNIQTGDLSANSTTDVTVFFFLSLPVVSYNKIMISSFLVVLRDVPEIYIINFDTIMS